MRINYIKKIQRNSWLMLIVLFCLTGCKQVLYSELSEQDVNEMMSVLMQHAIVSEKILQTNDLYSLSIEKKRISDAIELFKEHGLPREKFQSMGDIFKKEGLISSPMEEKVRFMYALSQNVSETLMQIDGVITARVHIVLPENNPFDEVIKPSSASVFIKYHPSVDLESAKSDIKLIVEKSIEGLDYDKVTVVMLPARRIGSADADILAPAKKAAGVGFWFIMASLLFAGFAALRFLRRRNVTPTDNNKPKQSDTVQQPVGPPLLRMQNPKLHNDLRVKSNVTTASSI